jgi:hypothetical protein
MSLHLAVPVIFALIHITVCLKRDTSKRSCGVCGFLREIAVLPGLGSLARCLDRKNVLISDTICL